MTLRVTLSAWASEHFSPPPSLWTLRKMVREGRIDPLPVKVGKSYYVQSDARPIDPNRRPTLVDRLRKAA
ncbi:MAG: excisionase [Comamonas sp.]